MKYAKKLLVLSLVAIGSVSLSGCNLFKKKNSGGNSDTGETAQFAFSIGLKSGASSIELGSTKVESIEIYDNGIDTSGRSYSFESLKPSVATIDQNGKITPVSAGRVNFLVTESKSGSQKSLKREIVINPSTEKAKGGYNFSGGTTAPELAKRTEILGKLEKYVMDTHLTGITLFENGGYVMYNDRVISPNGWKYVNGYGFGILSEGELDPSKPLTGTDGGTTKPTYYHSSINQDSHKINQFSATGSLVGDLASHITSTYWSTKLSGESYDWYPCLATDEIYRPTFDANGNATYATSKTSNDAPVPAEADTGSGLFRKWRVYVKVDGVNGVNLKYKTVSSALSGFNNRGVSIDDYEFIYKLLFTGSNEIIRGTEMANDTSYGIKGAQRFFNETSDMTDQTELRNKWDQFKAAGNLGIKTGEDVNGKYIDLELINPIDEFTAMYTLSSSLVSPLPESLFFGGINSTMKDSVKYYGTFGSKTGEVKSILDQTLCLGAFTLEQWDEDQQISFARNNDWFEVSASRYKIPGVYYRVIDTSNDTEKNWKQFNKGNLDSAGVPTNYVKDYQQKAKKTEGDSTFKLNVNSCNKAQWNELFGPNGKIAKNQAWDLKPWMSNSDFLDGLFYSIDRKSFAEKRGVNPSVDYFSNAYQMRNKDGGDPYNKSDAHKEAVKGFAENNGYNFDKAVDCFRNAVQQLSKTGDIVLGESKDNPTLIPIHIRWMYQTDKNEYGNEIAGYFERAFNDLSVCGGRAKLNVIQEAVQNWEDVYNEWMMKGKFDLAFGAISGNTYNPLNFLEVLKTDNSSSFTLNWGADTGKLDDKNAIIYDEDGSGPKPTKKWSFDALWEVADHGGIVQNGEKIKPVNSCTADEPKVIGSSTKQPNLYNGFDVKLPVSFAEFSESEGGSVKFDASRLDIYISGYGNITVAEKGKVVEDNLAPEEILDSDRSTISYSNGIVSVHVSPSMAAYVNKKIKSAKGYKDIDTETWHKNPFILSRLDQDWSYEFYYEMQIGTSPTSINYTAVTVSDN